MFEEHAPDHLQGRKGFCLVPGDPPFGSQIVLAVALRQRFLIGPGLDVPPFHLLRVSPSLCFEEIPDTLRMPNAPSSEGTHYRDDTYCS